MRELADVLTPREWESLAFGYRERVTGAATADRAQTLTDKDGKLPVFDSTASAPSSNSDTGKKGELRYAAGFLYFATADNTWVKWAVTTSF